LNRELGRSDVIQRLLDPAKDFGPEVPVTVGLNEYYQINPYRQAALDEAVTLWHINLGSPSQNRLSYEPSETGNDGVTLPDPPHQIKVGPSAYRSPSNLVSTLKHEGLHRIQYDQGWGWTRGDDDQLRILDEATAYDHELLESIDTGLSADEMAGIVLNRSYYESQLQGIYKEVYNNPTGTVRTAMNTLYSIVGWLK
jgi:hypothetical protein